MTSPILPYNGSSPRVVKCLEFAYHMHGASVNFLDVYTRSVSTGNLRAVWSRRGTQRDKWILAEVQLDYKEKIRVSVCESTK